MVQGAPIGWRKYASLWEHIELYVIGMMVLLRQGTCVRHELGAQGLIFKQVDISGPIWPAVSVIGIPIRDNLRSFRASVGWHHDTLLEVAKGGFVRNLTLENG